ncbi:MAG: type I-C CRISPR-associated protein Cas8c/Csd1, partial [Chloroherpetonaceae bacterium]|nr:type I-C CRISPR-associated protein Cas8c/Csd1 [Chloroherpetonaceae bacterium]
MILRQLVEDYPRILRYRSDEAEEDTVTDRPIMYQEQPVRWKLALDLEGHLEGVIPLSGGGKKDRGKQMLVPNAVRTSGIRPLLLADDQAYVLGVSAGDGRAPKKHEAFRNLVAQCAECTRVPEVEAVRRFLERWHDPEQRPAIEQMLLEAGMPLNAEPDAGKSDGRITFEVNGTNVVDLPEVRNFWACYCRSAQGKQKKVEADLDGRQQAEQIEDERLRCLVCGEEKPVLESMPVMIKRVPGGQTSGTALVSANDDAFESYGLKRAKTSPICADCGERFGNALNTLLTSQQTSMRVGNELVYVFWAADQSVTGFVRALREPDPEEVRLLLQSYREGKPRVVKGAFYALALSGNGGRAVVRDWISTTIHNAEASLVQWFRWQEVPGADGEQKGPLPLWRLAAALYRDEKDVKKEVVIALTQTALKGTPLPTDLLAKAVLRCRAENKVTHARAALMTLILRSRGEMQLEEDRSMTTTMNNASIALSGDEQAKLCGRLLAILEKLQQDQA